jgi:PIN domain nuclease of toxin-antitoxin system
MAWKWLDFPSPTAIPSIGFLVAQARHEGLTLVTRDPTVRRYPIDTLWD